MPRLKTKRTRPPPEGFNKIKPTLDDFELRLREVSNHKEEGKQDTIKVSRLAKETLWKIIQIQHERTRYVYQLYYTRHLISRELYEWLLRERYADKLLIAKWKKRGYEKLCCLQCIKSGGGSGDSGPRGSSGNSVCICRVPRAQLEKEARQRSEGGEVTFRQCVHCGCSGCASTD